MASVEQIAKFSSREYLPILIARSLPGSSSPTYRPLHRNCHGGQIRSISKSTIMVTQWSQVQNGNNLAHLLGHRSGRPQGGIDDRREKLTMRSEPTVSPI